MSILGNVAGLGAIQSDWAQTDEKRADFIRNKPDFEELSDSLEDLRVLAEAALPKSGGTMEGSINMNGQKLSGLNMPVEDDEAATKGYALAKDHVVNSFSVTEAGYAADARALKTLKELIDAGMSADLLWENASPSSNFASQTVTVDCSDYRSVRIQFSTTPGASSRSWWDIPVGSNGICITGFYPSTGFTVVTRIATVSETAINFGKDIGKIYASSETIINGTAEYMIPLKIYGMK